MSPLKCKNNWKIEELLRSKRFIAKICGYCLHPLKPEANKSTIIYHNNFQRCNIMPRSNKCTNTLASVQCKPPKSKFAIFRRAASNGPQTAPEYHTNGHWLRERLIKRMLFYWAVTPQIYLLVAWQMIIGIVIKLLWGIATRLLWQFHKRVFNCIA